MTLTSPIWPMFFEVDDSGFEKLFEMAMPTFLVTAAFRPACLENDPVEKQAAIWAKALSWILTGWSKKLSENKSIAASTSAVGGGGG